MTSRKTSKKLSTPKTDEFQQFNAHLDALIRALLDTSDLSPTLRRKIKGEALLGLGEIIIYLGNMYKSSTRKRRGPRKASVPGWVQEMNDVRK